MEYVIHTHRDAHEIVAVNQESWWTVQEDVFANAKRCPDITVLASVTDRLEDYDLNKMQDHVAAVYKGFDMSKLPGINEEVPVVWTHNYGKGRVFVCAICHGPDTLCRPNMTSMLCRGTEWAASGEVTIPYPDIQGERLQRMHGRSTTILHGLRWVRLKNGNPFKILFSFVGQVWLLLYLFF